jgi:aspartate-semialdehyde dehydrogenase
LIPRDATIAVVGATGAVGREALAILASRGHSPDRIRAIASERSRGMSIPFAGASLRVEAVSEQSLTGLDACLFCATSQVAKQWAHTAVRSGAFVVDNSSAFRADPATPLVVPEVNAHLIPAARLIANPNCSTIMMVVALEPLRRAFGLARIVVATYQAVSGAGAAAMDELRDQATAALAGSQLPPRVFREPCAFNVFSHNAEVDPLTGVNGEEAKMIAESRKIWNDRSLEVSPTCVRVPVFRAHTQAITVTLAKPATLGAVRDALASAPGVRIVDDARANNFPTPLKASGRDDVLVGRIRTDPSGFDPHSLDPRATSADRPHTTFCLMLSADQLRKGAALNAIQIADVAFAARRA